MFQKKLMAMIVASLLPFSASLIAEESVSASPEKGMRSGMSLEVAEVAIDKTSVAEEGTQQAANTTENSEPKEDGLAAPETSAEDAEVVDRWKKQDEHYQSLKRRAEEVGVMLPERPPWLSSRREAFMPSMEERQAHHQKMMSMSQEERDAYRQERYQEMRAQAQERGIEMPETPPWVARRQAMEEEWAKQQEVIKGMTDEERAACHAMHQRHMGMGPGPGYGRGCGAPRNCMNPGGGQGGMAPQMYPPGAGQRGMMPQMYPGYGYGPGPYSQGNFWNPNQ
ncbi:MAG: hypothetical protein P8179_16770 [Candidatus Thiodiazotropha sp.]|jgi:hypothetical protein